MALHAPIQHHIDALAVERGYPDEAVKACLRQSEQAVPILFALLQRAARGRGLDDAEASQLFLGIHILAQLRHEASCASLLRLLRQDTETLEDLLSDAITETLPAVVASVYDGDADALFDMIADSAVDELVRDALWHAAATLTLHGRIDREAMVAFILRFDDQRLAPHGDMGWYGWLDAIMTLGLADLAPRVEPLWSDSRLPEKMIEREHFEKGLAAGVRSEPDLDRVDFIDDVAEALSWADWDRASEPYVNPMRNVGRNDPCPCGSGKKAKRCCLAPT